MNKIMKYIIGGKIITPDGIVRGKALAYDERIAGFVDPATVPEGAEVIDARGMYVSPGFIDIHNTAIAGDASDGRADGHRIMAEGI